MLFRETGVVDVLRQLNSRSEGKQLINVAADEGNVVNLAILDDTAKRRIARVDERNVAGNVDNFGDLSDRESNVRA